jgi:predicted nucleic-acid-binding Zn-ribbon protein
METEHPRCSKCDGLVIVIHEVRKEGRQFICKTNKTCTHCGHTELAEYHLSTQVVTIEVIGEVL